MCEDTRRTRQLLSHLGLAKGRLVSFFEGNERRRIPEIVGHLREGRDVALVSDAGMPGLSDPGYRLVAACVEAGLPVDVAPGPSSVITALVLSGLPTARFAFEGFLARKAGERRARLAELATERRTIVLFESPRRVGELLADAIGELGGERRAAIARELTKAHQEVLRGSLAELATRVGDRELRGEVVVLIDGARRADLLDIDGLADRVEALTTEGMPRKEAAARVAEDSGASKRELYEASLRRRA